jgi:MULE transposase domain/SWIM zinc finger
MMTVDIAVVESYKKEFVAAFPIIKLLYVRQLCEDFCSACNFDVRVFLTNEKLHVVVCKNPPCLFKISAYKRKDGRFYLTGRTCFDHTCDPLKVKDPLVHSRYVAGAISQAIIDNPAIPISHIRNSFRSEGGINLQYHTAYRGKAKALANLHGDFDASYSKIPSLIRKIQSTVPSCSSELILLQEGDKKRFLKCFLCYEACAKAFYYCRPVLVLDATHIKNKYKGVVLAACSMDGNNEIVPIAFALTDIENYENWVWFLNCLKQTITSLQCNEYSLISDRAKGLTEAVAECLPLCNHYFCVYHLSQNVKARFRTGDEIFSLIFRAAKAFNGRAFKAAMDNLLLLNPQVYEYLDKISHGAWTFYSAALPKFGMATSNLAESFNSWIGKERTESHLDMMINISRKIMVLFNERRKKYSKIQDTSRYPRRFLTNLKNVVEHGKKLGLMGSTETIYLVMDKGFAHTVDLAERTCTCGRFQQLEYPCKHVARVLQENSDDELIHSLVDPTYTIEFLKGVYEFHIVPIRKEELETNDALPPDFQPQPGRPKKVRERTRGERGPGIICSECNTLGHHNCRTCTRRQQTKERAAAKTKRALRRAVRELARSDEIIRSPKRVVTMSRGEDSVPVTERSELENAVASTESAVKKPRREESNCSPKRAVKKARREESVTSITKNVKQGTQKGPKKSVKMAKSNTTPVCPKINWNRERKEQHLKVDTQENANDLQQNKARVTIGFDDLSSEYSFHEIAVSSDGSFDMTVDEVKTPKVIFDFQYLMPMTENKMATSMKVHKVLGSTSYAKHLGIQQGDYLLLKSAQSTLYTNCYQDVTNAIQRGKRPIKLLIVRQNKNNSR